MKQRILVIDDDERLNALLVRFFQGYGLETITATHPDQGLKLLRQKAPDLVILDIMLPGMNGFEVCKLIRKTSDVPIIMLTAKGDLMDKVVGLELGADDYIAKPFEPREIVARIQSVLRRLRPAARQEIRRFAHMSIDVAKRSVEVDGRGIELTTTEFTALKLLAENPGTVLSRDQILDELRGIECEAYNRSVDITMSRLRQKLHDDPHNPRFIKTVWGTGYMFIAEEEHDAP
ncbi:MAG: response regulator transcription factor [Deltaproteobacteria bacterium]|nr:response regulator transcription factor [Deltaproteobacteria bacterium]